MNNAAFLETTQIKADHMPRFDAQYNAFIHTPVTLRSL